VAAGRLPARPFLLTGQMTTADPTRSPPGTETFWAYTHVPQHAVADAAGELAPRWDDATRSGFADRIEARIEALAPGFRDLVIARHVLAPPDFARWDANLVNGDVNGGTAQLHQQLIFRPIPGAGRAGTPLPGLYLASASAHPGGGVHGACGANAARAALAHDRVRRLRPRAAR
jgi:phytoene dehydrogenase-like protein